MSSALTYLYVPGDVPERFDKALASGADPVVLDLGEAGLSPNKDSARAAEAAGGWGGSTRRWGGRRRPVVGEAVRR